MRRNLHLDLSPSITAFLTQVSNERGLDESITGPINSYESLGHENAYIFYSIFKYSMPENRL